MNPYQWIYGQPPIPELLDDEPPPKLNSSIKAVMRRLGYNSDNTVDFFQKAYDECHAPPYDMIKAFYDFDKYRKNKSKIPAYVKKYCEAHS